MSLAAMKSLSVPDPSGTIQLPTALVEKCFIPYVRNVAPSLNGHPVVVDDPESKETATNNALLLPPVLIDLAQRVLKAEIDQPKDKTTMRITALCTPQLDSPLAVDAAVRHLAHHFKADVIILDAEDLADGENGVLGVEFSRALWTLYSRHYELKADDDALGSAERVAGLANEALSRCKGALEDARRATIHHRQNSISTRVDHPVHEAASAGVDSEEPCTTDDDPAPDAPAEHAVPPDSPASHPVEAPVEDDDNLHLRSLEQDVEDAERSVQFALQALADLKAQHAVRARHRAVYYATALNWLRRFLRGGGSPFRRRFLYLRNFGAMAPVFTPLISPLLSAIDDPSLKLPTIVLAGVGHVRLLDWVDGANDVDNAHAKAHHDEFLQAFDSNATLLAHVKAKYAPEWRQTESPDGRASSLADLFSRAILDQHAAGHWRLRPRGHSEDLQVDSESVDHFQICNALALALESDDSVDLTESEQDVLARRVLAYHVPDLHATLGDGHDRQWFATPAEIVDQWMALLAKAKSKDSKKAPPTSTATLLCQVLHTRAQLTAIAGRLASWLPPWVTQPIKTSDVFAALDKSDAALAELQRSLSRARDGPGKKAANLSALSAAERVRNAKDLDEYETRLLGAIVDPATISTTYEDVCIQPHIVETLRSVVSLPLLYADAYSTGILGRESMAGVLLYGPPGTGKTMLCRALAKESGANMLQIQASTIRSTWHSEDEKLIHATFTLARRLGPCVIFIDEIDALFGSRAHSGQVHRATLTEFLQEMDGLKSASENKASKVVIVGATNRPQDLDDAVLRRLPRRVMVDLPGSAEREKIIKHYLAGETTDETVDIPALASRTESYSGSDLKHLVFSAALAAFKDTIPDIWTRGANTVNGKEPMPQRVLSARHFEQALTEVSASANAQSESIEELRSWGGVSGS